MKKFFCSKTFVFFAVILSIFTLFSSSVFATDDDTYSFTSFDGQNLTVPAIPDKVNDYKQYVMVQNDTSFYIFCFNDKLEVKRDSSFIKLNGDDGKTLKMFKTSIGQSSWSEFGEQGNYSVLLSSSFLTSSKDLLKYGSKLNGTDDFFFQLPTVEAVGTLAPIVEETPLEGVLQEIVEILPVVLVIIVGLIGLRKALAMLSRVLHQS